MLIIINLSANSACVNVAVQPVEAFINAVPGVSNSTTSIVCKLLSVSRKPFSSFLIRVLISLFHCQKFWMEPIESLHPSMFFVTPLLLLIQDLKVELENCDPLLGQRASEQPESSCRLRSDVSCLLLFSALAAGSLSSSTSPCCDKQAQTEKEEHEAWARSERVTARASAAEDRVSRRLSLWQ